MNERQDGDSDVRQTILVREKALEEERVKTNNLSVTIEKLTLEANMRNSELAELQETHKKTFTMVSELRKHLLDTRKNLSHLQQEHTELKNIARNHLVTSFGELIVRIKAELEEKAESAIEDATRDIKAKYRYEFRQRKLLYNKLQELKGIKNTATLLLIRSGNIRVFCRVRYDERVSCVLQFPDAIGLGTPCVLKCPVSNDDKGGFKTFEFDRVYSPSSTQDDVFEDTDAILTSCADGYNVCLLAYGQTGKS